ncbi:hypothetical protein [Actinoplanes siamensis]|nr:hypothetical protein [Actinoplanes siamensis]
MTHRAPGTGIEPVAIRRHRRAGRIGRNGISQHAAALPPQSAGAA